VLGTGVPIATATLRAGGVRSMTAAGPAGLLPARRKQKIMRRPAHGSGRDG